MAETILGFPISTLTVSECAEAIAAAIESGGSSTWMACLNPHSYVVAKKDAHFRAALMDADWLIPDGIGVVFASMLTGGCIRSRVTGPDLFNALNHRLNALGGINVFFLGGSEETLLRIRARMAEEFPRIRVVGSFSPPYKNSYSEGEIAEMISRIRTASPDVLWVGMTAPKQEKWIYDNLANLNVKFAGAIGAAFDFWAGTVKRPDPIFRSLGLEWLPRLIRQPRRLWRRTFISAPIFMLDTVKECVRRHRKVEVT
jgi:N-acetylglucosaminyldiphosphoundecaprenol N-acetyl-beta-D-mannosaminyltransferase